MPRAKTFTFPTSDDSAFEGKSAHRQYDASRRIKADEMQARLQDLQANIVKLDLSKVEAIIVLTMTNEDEETTGWHVEGVGAIADVQSMLIHALMQTKGKGSGLNSDEQN